LKHFYLATAVCRKFIRADLVKSAVIYTVSGALSALVAFLLLPVLTRYLTPRDYGVVETFTTIVTCVTGVVLVGGNTILAKEYFDHGPEEQNRLLGRLISMACISSLCLAAVFTAAVSLYPRMAEVLRISNLIVYLAILAALANAIITLQTTLRQVEKQALHYALFVNSKTVVEMLLSLGLILIVGLKWQGRIAGMMISGLLYAGASLLMFRRRGITTQLPFGSSARIFKLGLPLVAAHLSVWIYGMLDRLMINHLYDLNATGLYSVGFRVASVVSLLETACSLAWMPYFYEMTSRRKLDCDERIVKLTYAYGAGLLLVALGFAWSAEVLLPFIVGPKFVGAGAFLMPLCLAFWLSGVWKTFGCYLIAEGRTKTYGYITSTVAVVHIVVTYNLLRKYGIVGAAWATLLTFAIATTVTIITVVFIRPMPWGCLWRRSQLVPAT
jgi:O-antigen/teichoic acid export membrane protein